MARARWVASSYSVSSSSQLLHRKSDGACRRGSTWGAGDRHGVAAWRGAGITASASSTVPAAARQ